MLQQVDVSKNRVPQNGLFIMETPIKIHDFGVPLFLETPRVVETTKWAKMVDWELKMVALRGFGWMVEFLLDVLTPVFFHSGFVKQKSMNFHLLEASDHFGNS